MGYNKRFYHEEITGRSCIDFAIGFLRAHNAPYTCKILRQQRENALMTWSETVYILDFVAYPHEYDALINEL